MRQFLMTILTICFMTSCDCVQKINGTIVDSETGKSLSNITVYNKNKSWSKTKTDTAGHFELSNVSGGFSCPPMTIVIEEVNYKKIETSIEAGGEKVIRLERIKQIQTDTVDQTIAIKTIRDIFENYKHNEEGIDSDENKSAITKSLQSLKLVTKPKDLELLINVWHYYDPTDYSCRPLVLNVLLHDKTKSIAAIKDRMNHLKSWETGETEFKYLLKELEAK